MTPKPTKYLKGQYRKSLFAFAAINVAAFSSFAMTGGIAPAFQTPWTELLSWREGLLALIVPVVVLILGGLLSADAKARWIYWRLSNPLPASEAFSRYLRSDPRINVTRLESDWGPFPTNAADQNRLWYRMYKAVEKEIPVEESHVDWLFSRDLTGYAVIFLLGFGAAAFVTAPPANAAIYASLLLAQYALAAIAARTYGSRFVSNVLALSPHQENSCKTSTK